MFEIVVIITSILTLILLKIFLNVRFKAIKELKNRSWEELEKLTNKFPNDEKMCRDILKKLNNENVKIKIDAEYASCLYTVFNNTITIGKFQQNYMKPQTIAHECIHSTQDKRMLWTNFIISNIYLIYFIAITILSICNYLSFANIHILILIFLSLIQYVIRNNLEMDAMIKARYIAKEFIEENKILIKEEQEKLLKEYDEINKIGIGFTTYSLITSDIIKIILFSIIVLI